MSVTKEWMCAVHGEFEGVEPICPSGCNTVKRVFLTPVGFASDRTKGIDRTLQKLAGAYGLTDMNNRGGAAVKAMGGSQEQKNAELAGIIRERYGEGWGDVPKGGTLNVKTGKVEGSGPGAAGALAAYGAAPDNVLGELKDSEALKPKPVMYTRDPENLKVSDARPPA